MKSNELGVRVEGSVGKPQMCTSREVVRRCEDITKTDLQTNRVVGCGLGS